MFYMPNTRMLFGDAKTSCDGTLTTVLMFLCTKVILTAFPLHSHQSWSREERQSCLPRIKRCLWSLPPPLFGSNVSAAESPTPTPPLRVGQEIPFHRLGVSEWGGRGVECQEAAPRRFGGGRWRQIVGGLEVEGIEITRLRRAWYLHMG